MMQYSYISYLDYHKPCYKLSVNEVLDKVDDTQKNKNYISKYSNLDEISIELRYNQFEMYDEMMQRYFESHNRDDIRYLIFTGKDYFTNSGMSVPYYLVGKYQLNNASIIALNVGCSGTPQGIELADHIIKADPTKKVMIVSLSKIGSIEERYEWPSLNGDAAGIMVLGNEGFLRILDCYSLSDGSVSLERCTNIANHVEMDLMKRENLLMLNVKKMLLDILNRNNLSVNDIHKYVPQTIHYLLYRMYAKSINVKLDRFFLDNIPYGGHLGDVDSTRNLKDAFLKYNESIGNKYMLFTLGDLGDNFSYNAVLMESC